MKSFKTLALIVVAASTLTLAGCATDGGLYRPQGQSNQSYGQVYGVIYSVRPTTVQVANASGIGLVGGAVAGGVLGNQVGKGSGRKWATVIGAVGGGMVGNEIEKRNNVSNVPGVEMQVRVDTGEMINIVQQDQGQGFRSGTRVRLIQSGNGWTASY